MIGFGDNVGSGIPAILATWKEEGWVRPELKEDTILNQVTLTLEMVKDDKAGLNLKTTISQKQEKLLEIIAKNPSITRSELAEVLDVSLTTVQKYISSLKKASILIRHGGTYGGYWEVNQR